MGPYTLNGDKMKDLMNQQKLSFRDLSQRTSIDKATLHRYANDLTTKIPIDRIWQIAFALGTTVDYLTDLTDDPRPEILQTRKNSSPILKEINNTLSTMNEEKLKTIQSYIDFVNSH